MYTRYTIELADNFFAPLKGSFQVTIAKSASGTPAATRNRNPVSPEVKNVFTPTVVLIIIPSHFVHTDTQTFFDCMDTSMTAYVCILS